MDQEDRIAMLAELIGNEQMEAYLHTQSLAQTTTPSYVGHSLGSCCAPTPSIAESWFTPTSNIHIEYKLQWDEEEHDNDFDDEYDCVEFGMSTAEMLSVDDTAVTHSYYNNKKVRPVTDTAYEAAMSCVGAE